MRDTITGRFVNSIGNRTCLNCGSDKTYLEDGKHQVWFNYKGGYICKKCRGKLIDHPKWHPIHSPRRICFKNRSISLSENPRIGICNWCCAVVGVNCKRTHIHHLEYHEGDPLKDTVELCPSCHYKESWRLRRFA